LKKKLVYSVFALALIISAFLMFFYGQKTFYVKQETNTTEPKYDYHFVLIPEEEDNEYWRQVEKGARDAAEEQRVYLEYIGPKRANLNDHVRVFDKEIAGKVDGIMVQGLSNEAFTPLINKAVEKGTAIITIDTDVPESRRDVYVGTDNYMAGFMAGKAFIEDTKGEQMVGIVIGREDAIHQQLRVEGFKEAVKNELRIKIVGMKESNISKTGAVQATYDLLKENPNITAFYGTSALDGIGIAQVIRTMRPYSDPYVITFDTLPETIQLLEAEEIDAIVVQHPYKMGYTAVNMLVELKKGNHPEKIQHTPTSIIRKNDLDQLLQEDIQENNK